MPRVFALTISLCISHLWAQPSMLPAQPDWLRMVDSAAAFPSTFTNSSTLSTLSNGLITRVFTSGAQGSGSFGTTELRLEAGDGTSFLRSLAPEARVYLDGLSNGIDVGGYMGQAQYLTYYQELVTLVTSPFAMRAENVTISTIVAPYAYVPRYGVSNSSWPPKGLHLSIDFGPPAIADIPKTSFLMVNDTETECDPAGCLVGWHTCNNASVPGQCSFPRATAQALCEAWPACLALNCNGGRDDCQARGSAAGVHGMGGYTSYFRGGFQYDGLRVTVHYEIYDGIPAMSKWLTVTWAQGYGSAPVLSQASIDIVHVPWELRGRFHAETAYMPSLGIRNSFEDAGWYTASGSYSANFSSLTSPPVNIWVYDAEQQGTWGNDDSWQYWYDTGMNETMLNVAFPFGPGVNITKQPFQTFRVYEILHESDVLERQGLARRRLLRTGAPATNEDMLPAYAVAGDSASIRRGADMAASVGFRSLHTSVDSSNMTAAYLAQVKSDVAYAHNRGMLVGFYVLLQNPPRMTEADEVIDPATGDGEGIACFATAFHETFRANIVAFVQATGMDFVDTDGPYEQAPCGSSVHEHHIGLIDSQYSQWRDNVDWYRTMPTMPNPYSLLGNGITITCPDPYEFASGTVSQPLGYTDRWNSLSDPWEYLLLARVYAYDGTLWKTPTNAIMQLDLSRAGNMASPAELQFYDTALATFLGLAGRYYGQGQLWQNAQSQAVVQSWMDTYQKYRDVLNGDIIHTRKPTGHGWDGFLHVDPGAGPGAARGFAMFFNPAHSAPITVSTSLNIYYCGFQMGANVSIVWMDGTKESVAQDGGFGLKISRVVPALGYAWAALF